MSEVKQIGIESLIEQQDLSWDKFFNIKPTERKKRWEEFKSFYPEDADYWEDCLECFEETPCEYCNDGWCEYSECPCGVNPYTTPNTNMVGMACMGMRPPSKVRDSEDSDE